jgi:hypothetical protein
MTAEICRRCGGCGAIYTKDYPKKCPACGGKGYTELQPVIDAELLQEQQRAPYTFRGMTIREVPIDEPVKGHAEQGYFRSAKEGLKIWGNTHRSE